MAPQVGLEPTTLRLTAGCSAIELLRNFVDTPEGAFACSYSFHNNIRTWDWKLGIARLGLALNKFC